LILFTGRIRIDSVMSSRSSSNGRNTIIQLQTSASAELSYRLTVTVRLLQLLVKVIKMIFFGESQLNSN